MYTMFSESVQIIFICAHRTSQEEEVKSIIFILDKVHRQSDEIFSFSVRKRHRRAGSLCSQKMHGEQN